MFLVLLLIELALTVYLVVDRRMVIGHDGFELLAHQWFFINSKVSHGEVPFWTPYMTHGLPTWWYFIYSRLDVFSNLALVFGAWLKDINFLVIYYGGLFFDKFILLVGVWLLAKRYFNSKVTAFFVASMVMASTVTYTQDSFPLVLIYSLPLIIYLLHRFVDTGRWMWVFLTAYLFCVLSINIYYFVPVISLAVFLYFLVAYFNNPKALLSCFKIEPRDLPWIGGIVFLGAVLAAIFFLGHDSLTHLNTVKRQDNGSVPLNVFLSFGGGTDLFKWWELFLGMSPQLDYTLYIGVLALPLIMLGIFAGKNPQKYPFVVGVVFFVLFACATPVTVASYYFWPLMKYFRHIALIAPLIKLYLCFLAGFGFHQLFYKNAGNDKEILYKSMLAGGILALNGIFLCQLIIKPELAHFILSHLGNVLITAIPANFSVSFIIQTLTYMVVLSFLGAGLFFLRPFIKFPLYASSFLLIFMLVHLMDVYWYAYQQTQLRTFSMTTAQSKLLDFKAIPYAKRRGVAEINPRETLIKSFKGAVCDSANNFTFTDMAKSKYRSDFCLKPFEKLFKIYDYKAKSPVFLKLAGVSEDKIQFFSQAHAASSDEMIVNIIKDQSYAGDMLFYESSTGSDLKGLDLAQNERVNLAYEVVSFSPNQIVIQVDTGEQSGVWMQYSDAWYPAWKAKINSNSQEVYRGSLAYKALPLEKGKNTIHLYYQSFSVSLLYGFFMFSALIWFMLLIWLLRTSPVAKPH